MKIIFTQLFNEESKIPLHITETQVKQVIYKSKPQILKFDNEELRLYLSNKFQSKGDNYLLVSSWVKNGNLEIDYAYIILPSLINEVGTLEPLILLQQLAIKFGLTIRIGNQLNKFIYNESIELLPDQEISTVIQILNPENHKFTQHGITDIVEVQGKKIIRCYMVYAPDLDIYLSWLNGERFTDKKGDISIEISSVYNGRITPYDLIEANGTIDFKLFTSTLTPGILFNVKSPGYNFCAGFGEVSIWLTRNEQKIEYPLDEWFKTSQTILIVLRWQPTELKIVIFDKAYQDAVSSGQDPNMEMQKRSKNIDTIPTLPPNSILEWARKQTIAPNTFYNSMADFYHTVTFSLQTITDKVVTTDMYNAFWDITYDGSKIVARKPKRETDIHPIIQSLLYDIALAKNLHIIPEYHIRGGQLDFLITGTLKDYKTANVCVEFKHAHSDDLLHGLIKQLPEYMRFRGADYGLYCVLYFKGEFFEEPQKYDDADKLQIYLEDEAMKAGISNNVRILIFNLSHQKSPSKL